MVDYIQTQRYAPYQEERMQDLYNTLFGIKQVGEVGDEDYVAATTGLLDVARPVPGQQLAAQTPEQLQAFQLAQQNLQAYLPEFLQAGQAYTSGLGALGQGATALGQAQAQYAPTTAAIDQFRDPYSDMVTQEALKEIDRQGALSTQALSAQAVGAGAFGGSRMGVQQAELQRNLQDIKSRRIYEDKSRNYQQALGASMAAQEAASKRQLGAGQALGQIGQGYGGIGQYFGDLGQGFQAAGQADIGSLLGIGQQRQAYGQTALDIGRANLLAQQAEPYQRMEYGANILQGMPAGPLKGAQPMGPLYMQSPFASAIGGGLLGLRGYQGITGQIPGLKEGGIVNL
jgi:hypothetical protein